MNNRLSEITGRSLLALLIVFSMTTVLFAEMTGKEIMSKTKDVQEVKASWSLSEQTITTSGGSKRTFAIESWAKDKNDKQLMIYRTPARVRGVKFLFLDEGDEIYTYFPKTDRVRHLASHMKRQKMMGSDFSYEDMSLGDLDEDYKSFKLLKTEKEAGEDCYVVEAIPSSSGPHYSKMIVWVDKKNFVTRKTDYFEDGKLLKRLLLSDIRMIDRIPTAMMIEMTNLQDGGTTTLLIKEMKYNVNPADSLFTVRNLKKR